MIRRTFALALLAIGVASAGLTGCGGPSAAFPVSEDPLATYRPPSSQGWRSELRTHCLDDAGGPAAEWSFRPRDRSAVEAMAQVVDHALAHDWVVSSVLRSTGTRINLDKKTAAVVAAGGRRDEPVSAKILIGDDGSVNVRVQSHLGCP